MDLTSLFIHAKPGTNFSPLDAAELLRLNTETTQDDLKTFAQTLLKKDLPKPVRETLETLTGEKSTYGSAERQRDFVRNRLGTEGMAYPEPEPEPEDNNDNSMELDFGDNIEDESTDTTPSPMNTLVKAGFDALIRSAQRSGQTSVIAEIAKALHKSETEKSITPLFPIFAKHDRELAMMMPYVAQDDDLINTLQDMANTLPYAQTCLNVLNETREGIANGFKPSAVFAAALLMLLAEKG